MGCGESVTGLSATARSAGSQITQAALSFIAIQVLSRTYDTRAFGLVSISLLLSTLWLSLHRAAFGEQLIARLGANSRGYNSFVAAWGVTAILLVSICTLLSRQGELLPGILYGVLFAVSDGFRYSSIAGDAKSGFVSRLLRIDLLRLTIGLASLVVDVTVRNGDLAVVILLMSCIIWPALGFSRVGSFPSLRAYLRGLGRFEVLVVVQYVVATGVSQCLPLFAVPRLGVEAVGSLRLAISITSPLSLMTTAFQPALLSRYAAESTLAAQRRFLVRTLTWILALAPVLVIALYLGLYTVRDEVIVHAQQAAVLTVLLPAVISTVLVPIGQPGGALIRVRRLGKTTLFGQLAGVLVGLPLCLAALLWGLEAFAWALTISSTVTVLTTYVLLGLAVRQLVSRTAVDREA